MPSRLGTFVIVATTIPILLFAGSRAVRVWQGGAIGVFSTLGLLAGGTYVAACIWILANPNRCAIWSRFALKLVFAITPLALLLGGIEGAARLLVPAGARKQPSAELQHIYAPATLRQARLGRAKIPQINRHGFRGPEFSFSKDPGEFRIIVLGGSVATGAYAESFENSPAVALERLLAAPVQQKLGKKLVVYSLAESGCDIEDEAFWFIKLGIHLQPDLVVSITGFNNLFNSMMPQWDKGSGGRQFHRPGITRKSPAAKDLRHAAADFLSVASGKLEAASCAYWALTTGLSRTDTAADPESGQGDWMASFPKPKERPVEAARRFRVGADLLHELCALRGIQYAVVLQPFRGCGPAAMQRLAKDGRDDSRDQLLYRTMMDTWAELGEAPYPVFDATVAVTEAVEAIDGFADSCHMWDHSFEVFNQRTAEWLERVVIAQIVEQDGNDERASGP